MQHIVFVTPMTVYKNVPSSPNMGPPAVALSARNKKQNNNSNESQNRFRVHDRETFRDFQRLSEIFRDFQRLLETLTDSYRQRLQLARTTLTVKNFKTNRRKNKSDIN